MFMTKKKHNKIMAKMTQDVYMQMQKNIAIAMKQIELGVSTVEEEFGPEGAKFIVGWALETIGCE